MKIKTEYFCFPANWEAERQIEQELLKNINKQFPIFNENFTKIDLEKKIFEVSFSTNYFSAKKIDFCIRMEGLRDMIILIKTSFSFGYCFYKRKIKKNVSLFLKRNIKILLKRPFVKPQGLLFFSFILPIFYIFMIT